MNSQANAQQVEYWNGPVGERWASLQERIDLNLADITAELIRFAAPSCGERLLDVGCGCGTTTFLLAMRTEPEGAAAGIDISVPMLNVARARAMAQNADIVFIDGDASDYDFQPVFDLIFSRFGIMFFANPVAAFANLRMAIARGGRMVFVCWRALQENRWAAEPLQATQHLLPPQEPTDPFAPGPFAFADGDRLYGILERAGFSTIEIQPFDGTVHMGATLEEAAAQVLNIGPLARAATDVDESTRAKIRRVVESTYAPYRAAIGVTPPAACWLVRAAI